MARPDHWGDRAGAWNAISRQLWKQLHDKVTYEQLAYIRSIRKEGTGNTICKREVKVLLAIRDGQDWRTAEYMDVDHKKSYRDGGRDDDAGNVRLLTQSNNSRKGARSVA